MNRQDRESKVRISQKPFRILALVMCAVMLLSLTPLAFAGESAPAEPEQTEQTFDPAEGSAGQTGGSSEETGTDGGSDETAGSGEDSGSGAETVGSDANADKAANAAALGADAALQELEGGESVYDADLDALEAGVPVEATGLASTNAAAYVTNQSNSTMLIVTGSYAFTDSTQVGTATDTLTVTLTNAAHTIAAASGKTYFTDAPSITAPAHAVTGSQNVQVVGKDIIISWELEGAYGANGNYTINYAFDHASFDGWVPDGSALANITATTSLQAAPKTLDVVSKTTNGRYVGVFTKTPAGDMVLNDENTLYFTYYNEGVNKNGIYWLNEPNTEYKFVLEYPKGAAIGGNLATIGAANGVSITGVNNPNAGADYGTVTWTLGTVDANGLVNGWTANPNTYGQQMIQLSSDFRISFPDTAGFMAGDDITLNAYAEYTLAGQTTKTTTSNTMSFKIKDTSIHMGEGKFAIGGHVPVVTTMDGTTKSSYSAYSGIENTGGEPIPNACFTWHNDTTEKKANIRTFVVYNHGTLFKTKLVLNIEKVDTNGDIVSSRTETAFLNQGLSVGGANSYDIGSATTNASNLKLEPGEYVESIAAYPLNNPNDSVADLRNGVAAPNAEMIYPAVMRIDLYYTSWEGGKFPNGTTIAVGDVSNTSATLSWNDESDTASHIAQPGYKNGATYSYNAPTSSLSLVGQTTQIVHYQASTPNPSVWYATNNTGSLRPGDSLDVDVKFFNSYNASNTETATIDWVNPVLVLIPPDSVEVDMGNTSLPVFKNGVRQSGLTGVLTETTVGTSSQKAYKITISGLNIEKTSNVETAHYSVPVTFKVKAGTTAGTYYLGRDKSISGFSATCGTVFGTSATPNDLIYPNPISDAYYGDTHNYDNNVNTTHLKHTTATVSFSVAPTKAMNVTAQLLNNGASPPAWMDVNETGAQSTVQIDDTGQFRLIIENVGNSYLGDVQLLNLLPQAGDKRGSEWTATLSGAPSVQILDADGNAVSSTYNYTFQYSTQADPSYTGTASGLSYTAGTDGAFSATGGTVTNAKSFLFTLNSAVPNRLAPGYKIVITGVLKAPTGGVLNKVAYNQFMANAVYYENNTNNNGKEQATQVTPTRQMFILADNGNASLTKSGVVFKDLDFDNSYDAGEEYEGAVAELFAADSSGNATGIALATTTTDSDGKYEFTGLAEGDYVVRVLPKPNDGTYTYVTKGLSTDATASHVSTKGYSDSFTLLANQDLALGVNAGLRQQYLVAFAMNDGTSDVYTTQSVGHGGKATRPAGTPARTDYAFDDWYDAASGGNAWNFDTVITQEATVFAGWFNIYKVNFHATAAATTSPYATKTVQEPATTLPATEKPGNPTQAGSVFLGWYEGAGGTGAEFVFGDAGTGTAVTADKDVYAKWEKMKITGTGFVYKDLNGNDAYDGGTDEKYGDGTGITTSIVVGLYKENSGTWTKVDEVSTGAGGGYEFTAVSSGGWDGSAGTYRVQAIIPAAGIGFYATDSASFTVADGAHTDVDSELGVKAQITINAEFKNQKGTLVGDASYEAYGQNKGYYYDTTSAASITAVESGATGHQVNKPAADAARYTISTAPGNNPQTVAATAFDFDDTATFTQKVTFVLQGEKYTITFNGNGGTPSAPSLEVNYPDTISSSGQTLPTASRPDYIFGGWYNEAGCTTEFDPAAAIAANKEVYAKWTPEAYTVTFNGNGADVQAVPGVMTVTRPATTISALPVPPSRAGYIFDGWNFERDGSGAIFNAGTDVNSNIIVYAQWSAAYYQLAFDLNGGSSATPQTQSLRAGDLAAAASDPTRADYTFLGWNTDRSGGGTAWSFASTKMPASDVTLFAQWQHNGTPPTTPDPPPVVPPVNPPNPPEPPVVDPPEPLTPDPTPDPDPVIEPGTTTEVIMDGSTPSGFEIGEDGVPLFGGAGAVWALLNFILMLAGGIFAVILLLRTGFASRKDDDEVEYYEAGADGEEEPEKKTRPLWTIVSVILGAVGVIVFLLTEDLANMMVWMDQWTVLMVLILAAELVAFRLSFKKSQETLREQNV